MHCPKCQAESYIKYGHVSGKQRYRCKQCGCQFTRSTTKGISTHIKRFALQLYLEGLGFRSIERVLNVSNVTVMRWVKKYAYQLMALQEQQQCTVDVIEIDELHHYIGK